MPNYIKLGNLRIEIPEANNNGGGEGLLNGLLAFYNLGDLSDASGNGNALTNNGGVTFSSGKIGNAATFSGSNGLNRTNLNDSAPKTLSAWFNIAGGNGFRLITNFTDAVSWGVYIQLTSGNGLRIGYDGQGGSFVNCNSNLNTNTWYHVAFTNNGSQSKLYLNGELDNQGNSTFPETYAAMSIGSGWNAGYDFFTGQIDAVGMWSRVLSDAEITELYNAGAGKEHPFA